MQFLETGLRVQDIYVLTRRKPKPELELESNNKLLCFGKLKSMRGMILVKTRERPHPEIVYLPASGDEFESPHLSVVESEGVDQ